MTFFTVCLCVNERNKEHLPRALASIAVQTHHGFELLIAHEGKIAYPGYNVERMLRQLSLAAQVIWYQPEDLYGNRGKWEALMRATGSHICFVECQNLVYPEWLSCHAANLSVNPFCVSAVNVQHWEDGSFLWLLPNGFDRMGVDLLSMAYPVELSKELGGFTPWMGGKDSDYLLLRECSRFVPVLYDRKQPIVGASF